MNPSRETLGQARILVVGDIMLDRYWFGDVDRISPEAPVPVVHVKREEFRLGGAANVARNIASLGACTTLMSVVGADEAADRVRAMLDEANIAHLLEVDPSLPTTVKLRVGARSQQLIRIDFESRPDHLALTRKTDAYRAALQDHDVVVLSDYGKGGLAHVHTMIALARATGKPVLVDPKGSDYSVYAGASIITPNRSEFEQVTGPYQGEDDLRARADHLRARLGLEALLVTRSEEGMSLFDDMGHFRVAAAAREVFDVTGAGDTVIATLAALLATGSPLRDAVTLANRAGGIVVGRFGTATIAYEELFA